MLFPHGSAHIQAFTNAIGNSLENIQMSFPLQVWFHDKCHCAMLDVLRLQSTTGFNSLHLHLSHNCPLATRPLKAAPGLPRGLSPQFLQNFAPGRRPGEDSLCHSAETASAKLQ